MKVDGGYEVPPTLPHRKDDLINFCQIISYSQL